MVVAVKKIPYDQVDKIESNTHKLETSKQEVIPKKDIGNIQKKLNFYFKFAAPSDAVGFMAGFITQDPYLIFSRSIRGLINQEVMIRDAVDKNVKPERQTDDYFYMTLPMIPMSVVNVAVQEGSPYLPKKSLPFIIGSACVGLVCIAQALGRFYVPNICGQKPKKYHLPNAKNISLKNNKHLIPKIMMNGLSFATVTPLMVCAALKESPGAQAGYLSTICNGVINLTDTTLNPNKDFKMAAQDWFNLNISPLISVPGIDYVQSHQGYYENHPNAAFIPASVCFGTSKILRIITDALANKV